MVFVHLRAQGACFSELRLGSGKGSGNGSFPWRKDWDNPCSTLRSYACGATVGFPGPYVGLFNVVSDDEQNVCGHRNTGLFPFTPGVR